MPNTEHDALRAVAILYLEGMIWGQRDKLERAFHPKATAAGHFDGAYFNTDRHAFIDEWLGLGSLPPGTPFVSEISVLAMTGDVALVKVTDTCFGDDYTDYLTMICDEGTWQITHKAWFVHPRAT
jgi:hypothetical protein